MPLLEHFIRENTGKELECQPALPIQLVWRAGEGDGVSGEGPSPPKPLLSWEWTSLGAGAGAGLQGGEGLCPGRGSGS